MKTRAQYSHWMAEAIAKVYLLETGMLNLVEPSGKEPFSFDLLAIPKNNLNKIIPVEIKASQYSENQIPRIYQKLRKDISETNHPAIVFYINALDKTGFVELIDKDLSNGLMPLTTSNMRRLIEQVN